MSEPRQPRVIPIAQPVVGEQGAPCRMPAIIERTGEIQPRMALRTIRSRREEQGHASLRGFGQCRSIVAEDVSVEGRSSGDQGAFEGSHRLDHVIHGHGRPVAGKSLRE
jgi:hypothetical protein